MKATNTQRALIWIIVILVATNLSTIGSYYYHRKTEKEQILGQAATQINIPSEGRTLFFRDKLGLDNDQLDQVREINRTFNRTARNIEAKLTTLRNEIVDELGTDSPDSLKLDKLSTEVGNAHRELKQVTNTFYLSIKKVCTKEQQTKLHDIFKAMLNKENQVDIPRPGHQRGKGGPNR